MIHSIAISAALTFSASRALLFLANRVGWVDEPSAEDSERKLQAAPVPVIGGAAILIGLLVLEVGGLDSLSSVLPGAGKLDGSSIWLALVAAFLLGLVDDLRRGGLAPGVKVAAQVGVGLVVAHSIFALEPIATLACVLVVPLALNVWNTFDNADGAATGVGAIALFSAGSPAAGPVLGFLACNLRVRGSAAAYLGDSGSHLLGCLVLLHPGAWPLMLLPALDLLRVSCLRVVEGRAPWRGDRTHLAHRMQRKGLSPLRVALCLYLLAVLPLLWPGWPGLALGTIGFLFSVWASRPCPESKVG